MESHFSKQCALALALFGENENQLIGIKVLARRKMENSQKGHYKGHYNQEHTLYHPLTKNVTRPQQKQK